MESLFHGSMQVIMRSRLSASVIENEREIPMPSLALNEITIDRGPSHYICNLELFINDKYVCAVQGLGRHFFKISKKNFVGPGSSSCYLEKPMFDFDGN